MHNSQNSTAYIIHPSDKSCQPLVIYLFLPIYYGACCRRMDGKVMISRNCTASCINRDLKWLTLLPCITIYRDTENSNPSHLGTPGTVHVLPANRNCIHTTASPRCTLVRIWQLTLSAFHRWHPNCFVEFPFCFTYGSLHAAQLVSEEWQCSWICPVSDFDGDL